LIRFESFLPSVDSNPRASFLYKNLSHNRNYDPATSKQIIMSFQDVGKNNTHRRAASASMQPNPSQSSTIPETSSWTSGIASLTSAVTSSSSSSSTATVGQISESLTQFQVRFVRSMETMTPRETINLGNDVEKAILFSQEEGRILPLSCRWCWPVS
jgi:hypothetical protein